MKKKAGDRKTVLITGASAGIGRAFAEEFARHGCDLVLVARRMQRLEEICEGLRKSFGITARPLAADLADPCAPEAIYDKLQQEHIDIDVLVNNAGFELATLFSQASWAEHERFIQVMITSMLRLCHLFIPAMKARGQGRIINVASFITGMTGLGGDLYVAAKAFMVKASNSLYLELEDDGIAVTAVCPGFTRTEFHDVMGTRHIVDRIPGFFWMDAGKVARLGYAAAMQGRPVYIPGLLNKALAYAMHVIPDRLLLVIGRQFLKETRMPGTA